MSSSEVLGRYRAPHWTEALHLALPSAVRRVVPIRGLEVVPVVVSLAILALLALRLNNTAFVDEALYINAGRDYIAHWLHGTPVGYYGETYSGVPFVYPVLAAVLDGLGGLRLVRLFSLGCIVLAGGCLFATVRRMESRRAAYLAIAVYAMTGPVVFAGQLGTFDALVAALVATAVFVHLRFAGWAPAALAGVLLGSVPVVKYTGAVFVAAVIALLLLLARRRADVVRVCATAGLALLVPALGWVAWADQIRQGVTFTTTGRHALSPFPASALIGWLVLDIGVVLLCAVAGAVMLARRGLRPALVALVLLGAGLCLPAAQLRLGEGVSFDKHLSYSALFLAPLAGCALAGLSHRTWRFGPVLPILAVALLFGASRSAALFQTWVSVADVVNYIHRVPAPGLYLSSAADSLSYETGALRTVRWETTYTVYSKGDEWIRTAVREDRYRRVIIRSASTGAPDQDHGQKVLVDALRNNPDYRLSTTFRARSDSDRWLVFDAVEKP